MTRQFWIFVAPWLVAATVPLLPLTVLPLAGLQQPHRPEKREREAREPNISPQDFTLDAVSMLPIYPA